LYMGGSPVHFFGEAVGSPYKIKPSQIIRRPPGLPFNNAPERARSKSIAAAGKGDRDPPSVRMRIPVVTAALTGEGETVALKGAAHLVGGQGAQEAVVDLTHRVIATAAPLVTARPSTAGISFPSSSNSSTIRLSAS